LICSKTPQQRFDELNDAFFARWIAVGLAMGHDSPHHTAYCMWRHEWYDTLRAQLDTAVNDAAKVEGSNK
jgi:hypothetical protein